MSKPLSGLTLAATTLATFVSATEETEKIVYPSDHIMVRPFRVMDFQMELVLVATFLAYVFVWYRGKTANLTRAKKWLGGQMDYLEKQFALVGDKMTNGRSVLMVDGPADYLLYTSGRRHVEFGHWWIKLKPRNDLLTYFSTQLLSLAGYAQPAQDKVNLTMTLDKALPEKFTFAVVKQDLATDLFKKRFDLSRVGKLASSNVIPAGLRIYSETQKLADTILSGRIGQIIVETSDRLESLVISSLPAEKPEMFEADGNLVISLDYVMNKDNGFDPLVELACELPDYISQYKLTGDIKSKINKNREELVKEFSKKAAADRAEELQKKKAEAKRAEEERIKKMSPAEQRKWEEKERVRNMKKQQKKRKM